MNWPEVFKGIQLCIGFQLFLIAVFLLASKQKRNHLLGIYTILISISSLSSGFYYYLEQTPFLSFLFGAHLVIFHAPLLFLYIKSLGDHQVKLKVHFVFPLLYTAFYLLVKFYFVGFFDTYNFQLLIGHLSLSVAYTGTYFYRGSRYFYVRLNDSLKQKALKKFRLFYVITNSHAICLYSLMAFSYVSYLYYYEEFLVFNQKVVPDIFSLIVYIHPLTSIIFITYLLSETHSLQSLILHKGITKSETVMNHKQKIIDGIELWINKEKQFKDPDFGLKQLARTLEVHQKELAEYFNEELSTSFNDYLNQQKIEEFKRLVQEDRDNTYSLEGIARLSGFRSKATFYRVFKKEEGITPAQYKANQTTLTPSTEM